MDDDQVMAKLYEARDNLVLLIAEVTTKPKPNYEIDGQKVDWSDYLKQLQDSLKAQNQIIQAMCPYETHSTWYL